MGSAEAGAFPLLGLTLLFEKALLHALITDKENHLANLYRNRASCATAIECAVSELRTGLQNLHDWLECIVLRRRFEPYWDTDRRIRAEILKTLVMVEDRNVETASSVAVAEWIGEDFEEEIARASR